MNNPHAPATNRPIVADAGADVVRVLVRSSKSKIIREDGTDNGKFEGKQS